MQLLHDNRGATILEVLVTLGIFILFTGVITEVFLVASRSKDIVFEQLTVQSDARRTLNDLLNELRGATYSSIGAYPLEKASSTEIIFYSNIDTDSYRERVRYFVSGTKLKKGVIKPSGNPLTYSSASETVTIVANSVANTTSTFYYYGSNYTGTSAPLSQPVSVSAVRMVEVRLTLEKDANKSPTPFVITGSANIRNLKTN